MRTPFIPIAIALALALAMGACGSSEQEAVGTSSSSEAQELQDRVDKLEREAKEREAEAARKVRRAKRKAEAAERRAREARRKKAQAREEAAQQDVSDVAADPATGDIVVPDVSGLDHQAAQDAMQGEGLWLLDEKDCTGQDRMLLFDRNWEVVSTDPPAGSHVTEDTTITLCSKKQGE
jgi:uncharacterized protein HemX